MSFLYTLRSILFPEKFITSIDYINGLNFDYAETYSFCRGGDYESGKIDPSGYILSGKKLHPSAVKTQTFEAGHEKMKLLKEILRTEITEVLSPMCAPEYRDAIIFYNKKHEVVSSLNICLSCYHMQVKKRTYIDAAVPEEYTLLRQFFIDCGHAVED